MPQDREQMTVKQMITFLQQCKSDSFIFIAPSSVNEDEPPETCEFIEWEQSLRCVSAECGPAGVCIGYEK